MDTRVAILAIIAHDNGSEQEINAILHEHAEYIIGRMGLPYRERGMNIISVAVKEIIERSRIGMMVWFFPIQLRIIRIFLLT